ncbi:MULTISPECIES: ATP-dependent Clp protease proteolytic subunit [Leptolyngbya]|jgi:ATP-dependent Clp protease protease subunit|uniref:ATP-dependent Clp protease proteolytic subunit n=2 Tax=Leptolyngbya boryana TaxID=1184 RepID=A0A1Z4JMY6_LEPBY|nr:MULTISPECIES: ATP-dependent Clp protease proteolytic subunit [Leptolyngbya]BAY57987.1 ATP-dependent Clp protease proteolytic subunit [Leptolyngbya boryana NIES-2135]MBD1856250.1 ATP-dependent Clp protease proteolytic subunit [Leptolyngbya sp. FACHB-1624]MBD2367431.1 ATP-dependent Clp protease proteolytic subunit [Leptolyngbya sp. FACHB-161]MBD2373955.1 ATP-dependent Clp protease proteolytic subunit [Leptolyngbya sp. FACHB-238]MBD2398245.1 ATP-dependent Clp protease proteolytic subunit [Lept
MQVPYRLPGSQMVQWVDIYTRMAFERIIFLDDEIDDNNANGIVALLLYLNSEDATKPIYLYINSPGEAFGGVSSLAASMAIYDTMQYIKAPVHTICMGMAASSAVLLLSSGTKGSRLSLPNAEIVLSPQYGRSRGQATDIQVDAKKVLADRATFLEILSMNTGQSVEKLTKDLDRRFYLTAQEAKDYGLIDRVLESPKELPKQIPALV